MSPVPEQVVPVYAFPPLEVHCVTLPHSPFKSLETPLSRILLPSFVISLVLLPALSVQTPYFIAFPLAAPPADPPPPVVPPVLIPAGATVCFSSSFPWPAAGASPDNPISALLSSSLPAAVFVEARISAIEPSVLTILNESVFDSLPLATASCLLTFPSLDTPTAIAPRELYTSCTKYNIFTVSCSPLLASRGASITGLVKSNWMGLSETTNGIAISLPPALSGSVSLTV